MDSVRAVEPPFAVEMPRCNDDDIDRDDVALLKPAKLIADSALADEQPNAIAVTVNGPYDSESTTAETNAKRPRRLAGLGYIVFGALNISLMSTCVKFATRYVTSHEAVFWRSLLCFAFNYLLVRFHRVDLHLSGPHSKLLLLRCVFGTLSICFQFYAMSKMVLTDAVMIIFTSPVVTFALGAVVLRESVDRVDLAAALFSYSGVLFVTRPAFLFPTDAARASSGSSSDAVLSAMAAAVCQACAYIVMRKLHDVHHVASVHYFSGFGIFFSLAMLAVFRVPLRIPALWSVRLALVAAACFACVGLLSVTLGFQREKAGVAAVMRYFDVLFVIVWDAAFLGEHIHAYTLLGGAVILSGASIIAYRKANATTAKP